MKDDKDIKDALDKLPKSYQKLVKGFKIIFEPNSTLKGDAGHVGVIKTCPTPEIRLASPWHYPRSFVLYHEIGHIVWEKYVKGTELEKKWSKLVKLNKDRKKDEPDIENFCHAFGAYYSKHAPNTHDCEEWNQFIKDLPT